MAGEAARGTMLDARDMDHPEPISEGLLLQVPQAWVRDVFQDAITKDLQEWFVIDSEDEVCAAQNKGSGLIQQGV